MPVLLSRRSDLGGRERRSVSGLAHLLLGAFLLQRLELPVLLFVDEDPAALNVRHRLKKEKAKRKVRSISVQNKAGRRGRRERGR